MPGRVLLTLLACLLVLSGCSGSDQDAPTPSSSPRKDGCADVAIVGLRGQGQSLDNHRGGLGAEVDGVARALQRRLAADDVTTSVRAVRHPSRATSDLGTFSEDVVQGQSYLRRVLQQTHERCSDARVVVVGFSQGAQIAHQELAERPDGVRAVAFIGDPRRDPADRTIVRVDLPGPTPTAGGSLAPGPSLGPLDRDVVDACLSGDVVCSRDPSEPLDYATHKHGYEKPAISDTIATALLAQLTGLR